MSNVSPARTPIVRGRESRAAPGRPPTRPAPGLPLLAGIVLFAMFLFIWALLARSTSPDILPGPGPVWQRGVGAARSGIYLPAAAQTIQEAGLGWLVAACVALPLGYALGKWRGLDDALSPYLAGSQAMPIVAIAPILVVWAGFGLLPKVIVCALIAFFPMVATTTAGVRNVPADLRDAGRVFGGGWLSLAWRVDMPLSAHTVFAGVKVAAALSVTGAVVGEFVSSDQGLGYLLLLGRANFDTPLMFVSLLSLIGLGAVAYAAVSVVERILVRWDV